MMNALPRWDDPALKAGTMIRAALWLLTEVGEGNSFTKEQVRTAFPGVAQADRRIRDLRSFGWLIWASTEDSSLLSEEQRFVKAGLEVWRPEERRKAESSAISAKQRHAVYAADDFMCVQCGISGAEEYPEPAGETAVLSISRKKVMRFDGSESEVLVTECKRCRAGNTGAREINLQHIISMATDLDDADKVRLVRWMNRRRRGPTPLDRVWGFVRQLPEDLQIEVIKEIESA